MSAGKVIVMLGGGPAVPLHREEWRVAAQLVDGARAVVFMTRREGIVRDTVVFDREQAHALLQDLLAAIGEAWPI